ncbi:MAG: SHOCT domain-containing protein [Candidatus Caldatribacteriaceae bacterium]
MRRWAILGIGTVSSFTLPRLAWAGSFCPLWGMMGGWGWGNMVVGVLLLVFDRLSHRGYHSEALDILKKRYARGEVTQEEYQRMRTELER